ncbi:hypothetical protein JOM56_014190, partial [Amanita muscaria]
AEVQYFFELTFSNDVAFKLTAAMVRTYSDPQPDLLAHSHETLRVCRLQEDAFKVIDIKSIQAVVAMIPFPLKTEEEKEPEVRARYHDCFYVGEKPFFELTIEGMHDNGDSDDDA